MKLFYFLRNYGPLYTMRRVFAFLQRRTSKIPGLNSTFSFLNDSLSRFQYFLDGKFDRNNDIETTGKIPLKDLTISSGNISEGIWYEPMSIKAFSQIISNLHIEFETFKFIDFGSGKGRVLFLASKYGFNEIIGVEFAKELHSAAEKNILTFSNKSGSSSQIKSVCMDASEYSIPKDPLVIFFYSPFKGKVLEHALKNICESFASNPRKIFLSFYGENLESIEILKSINFQCKELKLKPDWTRFKQYRGFIFSSPI